VLVSKNIYPMRTKSGVSVGVWDRKQSKEK